MMKGNALCEVAFVGRVIGKIFYDEGKDGKYPLLRFRLKGGNKKGGTVYLDVMTYEDVAKAYKNLLLEGDTVYINGYIRSQTWKNKKGEPGIRNAIVAYSIHHLRTKARIAVDEFANGKMLSAFDPYNELGDFDQIEKETEQ